MANAVGTRATQVRSLAIMRVSAADTRATQARSMAVINYPSQNMKATQFAVMAPTRANARVDVEQMNVMVVARGRTESPYVKAWTYTLDGHDYYILQLQKETLVYDFATEKWHVWGTASDDLWRAHTGRVWNRQLALASQYGGSSVIAGDDTLGVLYFLDPEVAVDDSPDISRPAPVPFQRIFYGQILAKRRENVPCYEVYLMADVGNPALTGQGIELFTSDDSGHSFQSQGTVTIEAGNYTEEIAWRSLGQIEAPGRLFKLVDYGAVTRIDYLEMSGGIATPE